MVKVTTCVDVPCDGFCLLAGDSRQAGRSQGGRGDPVQGYEEAMMVLFSWQVNADIGHRCRVEKPDCLLNPVLELW